MLRILQSLINKLIIFGNFDGKVRKCTCPYNNIEKKKIDKRLYAKCENYRVALNSYVRYCCNIQYID